MTAASDDSPDARVETHERRPAPWRRWRLWRPSLKVVFALILSAAGLGSAWASYQSRLWGGIQTTEYARASNLRTVAAQLQTASDMRRIVEVQLFSRWLEASLTGEQRLAEAYRHRFPPTFRPRFEAWLSRDPLRRADEPGSPFEMNDQGELARQAEGVAQRASDAFEHAQAADHNGERFGQVNVVLATAMFVAGIANQFEGRRIRLALAGVGLFCCALALLRLLQLPTLMSP